MSEYLSKEEIKQWRSSLEKITLEEFAARLGKKVEEKKETNDLIDIILHGKPVVAEEPNKVSKAERLSSIADKAYEREKEIYHSPFSTKNLKIDNHQTDIQDKKQKDEKTSNIINKNSDNISEKVDVEKSIAEDIKTVMNMQQENETKPRVKVSTNKKTSKHLVDAQEKIERSATNDELRKEVHLVLKKSLTAREQKVLDYFTSHKNEIVYAKDLAALLEVPRDYVYKYIKNIREKIETSDALKNADKGGFIFNI